ncbi:MAG TPA: PilC/PilY family type IV pilus protein [Gammaproteobacteria bacterium]
MKNLTRQFKILFSATCLIVITGGPVLAVDTEIYVGSSTVPSEAVPNLVFIIDTSGSMDTDVEVSVGSYDPATAYTGSCVSTRIYYSTSGNPPSCGTDNYINTTSFTCDDAGTALGATGNGYYVGRAARYKQGKKKRGDQWDDLSNSDHDDPVECMADFGVHGETDASTDLYPADEGGGGPWTNVQSDSINWNNTGTTYTFYNANYLNWRNSAAAIVTKTRLQIVQEVFSDLMDSISGVNIAVMRFDSGGDGGYFVMPMQFLNDSNRQTYKDAVNAMTANGWTPLSETLYESYLFYKGEAVRYGDDSSPATNVAGVLDGGNYVSPIEYQCQKNFVILLTDGAPTYDTGADSSITGMSGFSTVTGASSCSGNCLDELADYMHTKDCSTLDDTQNVITYTIGFATDQTLLSSAAAKGGGSYYTADDTAGLADAFTAILTEILAINTTFIAPAVSVNAFNRFTHREELYYALFRPNERPAWNGNVKRFKLAGNPPIIVDANNAAAIDVNTGFFKSTARSFWTADADAPDGDAVQLGGAASRLALPRTIYTYTGSTAPANAELTATANALHEDNTAITKTMLGDAAMTDDERTDILQWTRGVDVLDQDNDAVDTDIRRLIGDPLHTKPVLISYGGTDASPDMTLYSGTNEGHLHAVNTSNGAEVFSFVPQELLPNMNTLMINSSSVAHLYGLDGPLTSWVNDVNGNGVLLTAGGTLETGEHVYLYQGMRRGGKNYYALDVTDRSAPKLKWIIYGGTGTFSELAQTWSAATKGKIKLNGVDKHVLIFGGGYDVDQDDNNLAADDSEGRAVFIVDASTGAKLWQAGPAGSSGGTDPNLVLSAMTNSIPSDVRVLDIDGDGYTDRLYVGDMRAQIWRFDIDNNGNTGAANLATGGVIAQLGGGTAAENRRFYYIPDVSLSDDYQHINIAIGSGYRAHPLDDDIHDAFFVVHDPNVYSPAVDGNGDPVYTAITLNDLYDATANVIGQGATSEVAAAQTALAGKEGLYIYLKQGGSFVGEKVLAKSITFSGQVMFTTYTPVATASASCSPSQGTARAYLINIADGTPVYDFNDSGGDLTVEDRKMELVRGGIPPEPSIIFHDNGPVVLIGTEKAPDPNFVLSPRKTRWRVQ